MEVAGYQRVQALLFVQLIRNFSAQLDALRSDRAALSRQLQRVSEAPPPATVRRAVSGGGAGSYGAAQQLRGAGDLVERLEINTRQEGAALMLAGQLTRALHTPLQFAKVRVEVFWNLGWSVGGRVCPRANPCYQLFSVVFCILLQWSALQSVLSREIRLRSRISPPFRFAP